MKKRKILSSVGSILVALTLIVGATLAWFIGDIGGGGGSVIVGIYDADAELLPVDFTPGGGTIDSYCTDYHCPMACVDTGRLDCIIAWEDWKDAVALWEADPIANPDPGPPGCKNDPVVGPAVWVCNPECTPGVILVPGNDKLGYLNLAYGTPIDPLADHTVPEGIGFIRNDGNLTSMIKLTSGFDRSKVDNDFFLDPEFVIAGTARNAGMFRTGQARLLGDGTDYYLILQPGRVIDAGFVARFDFTKPNPPLKPKFEFDGLENTREPAWATQWPDLLLNSTINSDPIFGDLTGHTNYDVLYILAPPPPTGEYRIAVPEY